MGIVLLEKVRKTQDPGTITLETWQRGFGKRGRSSEQQQQEHMFLEQLLNADCQALCSALQVHYLNPHTAPRSIIIPFKKKKMKKQSLKENQKVARLVTELGCEPRSVRL